MIFSTLINGTHKLTMSIATGSFRAAVEPTTHRVPSPDTTVSRLAERWETIHIKQTVRPGAMPDEFLNPLRILTAELESGSIRVVTSCDVIPAVTIPGMPPSQYPLYARSLVQYTMATLLASQPELIGGAASPALIHAVTICTAVRAGTWAALGRVPPASAVVSPAALRWSDRKQRVQVVGAARGDGTALWRHCLAMSGALLEGTTAILQVLVGLAPMLFVLGGAHVLSSGELYSYHFVEKELRSTIAARLPPAATSTLALRNTATWDMLVSSGLTGFAHSLVKQVCGDPAFIAASQIRVCRSRDESSRLTARLGKILAGTRSPAASTVEDPTEDQDEPDPFMQSLRGMAVQCDDTLSVADTVDFYDTDGEIDDRPEVMRSPGPRGSPIPPPADEATSCSTPRPVLSAMHRDQIVDAVRDAHSFGPRAASEVLAADPDETVKW